MSDEHFAHDLRIRILTALGAPLLACATPSKPVDPESEATVSTVTIAQPEGTNQIASVTPTVTSKASTRDPWKSAEGAFCLTLADSLPGADSKECGSNPPHEKLNSIPNPPSGMHGYSFDATSTQSERKSQPDACCYRVIRPVRGRPLRAADGQTVLASSRPCHDWATDPPFDVAGVPDAARAELCASWARDAALEHASVAEFARLTLSLLGLGAPARLVQASLDAARDEVRHAEIAYGVASSYAGHALGPGSLAVEGAAAPSRSLLELVSDALSDGCVAETLASLEARHEASLNREPALARALAEIAEDEARHAELAFAVVSWALSVASENEHEQIRGAIQITLAELADTKETVVIEPVAGRLSSDERGALRQRAIALVIAPALGALLDRSRARSPS